MDSIDYVRTIEGGGAGYGFAIARPLRAAWTEEARKVLTAHHAHAKVD